MFVYHPLLIYEQHHIINVHMTYRAHCLRMSPLHVVTATIFPRRITNALVYKQLTWNICRCQFTELCFTCFEMIAVSRCTCHCLNITKVPVPHPSKLLCVAMSLLW